MGSESRRRKSGVSEYRIQLPDSVDARQLLLALGALGGAPESLAPTLREFAPRFISQYSEANREKPSSIRSKLSHLKHHLLPPLGETPLDRISAEQVQALKATLATRKAKTVNNILNTLSKALKVAVGWGVIDKMPVKIELLPVQPPPFSFYEKVEYSCLLESARRVGPREWAVVALGGDCGLRKGEMVALEWRDVDFSRGQICISRSETKDKVTSPKGGRSRIVPMTPDAAEALRRIPRAKGPRVFYRDDGEPMGKHRLTTLLARAQRAAGIEDRGALHILRHTYCSHLAMAGVPVRTIQGLAGHTSLAMTERYMHLAPAEKDRAVTRLERYRQEP